MTRLHLTRTLAVLAAGLSAAVCAAQSPTTELVPVTATSRPFFSTTIDLSPYGYVEDEYLVTGSGDVYEYDAGLDVQLQTADVPYKTRILIRRPADPGDFSGAVLFELMNPTAGFDIDFEWHFNRELLLGDGWIWVGLTLKDVAIAQLETWDPARYGSLSLPDNGLAYAMAAQIGALLRDPTNPENPLAAYDVRTLIGTGYSQSADYLTTFSNEFHESALTWDGAHAFDGYLHCGGNGAARQINSADPIRYFDDRRYNTVNAPLIRVQSETEVAVFSASSITTRQPDSDVFRIYEVAGGSHADLENLTRTGEAIARDVGGPVVPPCTNPPSPLWMGPPQRAALESLRRWIEDGEAPPPSRLLDLGVDGVLRDAFGNALGGVRVPDIAVPLGELAPNNSGPGPCILAGSFFPFDEATLDELYPSHGRYVSKVTHSANQNRKDGYLLQDDAHAYVVEAAQSSVGQ
jgi:Alpha/beta hydrolase domain